MPAQALADVCLSGHRGSPARSRWPVQAIAHGESMDVHLQRGDLADILDAVRRCLRNNCCAADLAHRPEVPRRRTAWSHRPSGSGAVAALPHRTRPRCWMRSRDIFTQPPTAGEVTSRADARGPRVKNTVNSRRVCDLGTTPRGCDHLLPRSSFTTTLREHAFKHISPPSGVHATGSRGAGAISYRGQASAISTSRTWMSRGGGRTPHA